MNQIPESGSEFKSAQRINGILETSIWEVLAPKMKIWFYGHMIRKKNLLCGHIWTNIRPKFLIYLVGTEVCSCLPKLSLVLSSTSSFESVWRRKTPGPNECEPYKPGSIVSDRHPSDWPSLIWCSPPALVFLPLLVLHSATHPRIWFSSHQNSNFW